MTKDSRDNLLNAILFGSLGLIILIYVWLRRNYNYWERKGVPHVKAESYIFGNVMDVIFKKINLQTKYEEIYRKFINEPYCGLYEFQNPVLLVKDPDLIQIVLVEKFSYFQTARMAVNKDADELLYHNPFLLNGTSWKEARSIISSGLTLNKLRALEEIAKLTAQEMFKFIDNNPNDIEAHQLCTSFSSNVVANYGWGIKSDGFSESSTMKKMLELMAMTSSLQFSLMHFNPMLSRLFNLRFFTKELTSFLKNVTSQAIENKDNCNNNTVLQSILQAREKCRSIGKDISLTEITGYMSAFYVDAYETTSRTLGIIIYTLMLYPEEQQKVKDEINGIENMTIEEVSKLRYLDMFISEVNRFYSILPALSRVCSEDFKLGDLEIKAGTFVSIPISCIHHNSEYYPNPHVFNPENFSEENKQKRHKYTYFPFGAGPRTCPGQRYAMANMKLFLCYLLKRYDVVSPTNHTLKPIVPNLASPFILVPKDDLYVRFKKTS